MKRISFRNPHIFLNAVWVAAFHRPRLRAVTSQRILQGLSSQTVFAQQNSLVKPSASPAPAGVRIVPLTTRDLIFDPVGQRIYALRREPLSAGSADVLVR